MKKLKEITLEDKEIKNIHLNLTAELIIDKQNFIKFGNAEDIMKNHEPLISQIIENLTGSVQVGGTIRKNKGKKELGINADSINSAIRKKLKTVNGIHLETNVEYGSFIPQLKKGEFDFSIYDKQYNLYNLWNYCFGLEARYNGKEIYENLINQNAELQEDWNNYIKCYDNVIHKKNLSVPDNAFNIVGEIQFGNWAMVYKDMFRLVAAINKNARINLYIYICADDNLSKYISEGTVKFEKACNEFEENINNHSINCPVVIIPLNIKIKPNNNRDYIEDYNNLQQNLKDYKELYTSTTKEIKMFNKEIKDYNSKLTEPLEEDLLQRKNELENKSLDLNNKKKNLETLYSEIMEIGITATD